MRKLLVLIAGVTLLLANFSALPQARAATITVLNNNDSGAGSLRQAILDAISNDVIVFDSGLAGQTITLSTGEIAIGTNLTIDGSALSAPVTVSGNDASRIFNIGNYTVTLDTMILRNGFVNAFPSQGGAIYNNGTLTLRHMTLNNNHSAASQSYGGAIYNNGTLIIGNSTFTGNRATSVWSYGGAIYNDGTLTVTDSTFSNNSADSTSSAQGGTIFNNNGRSATFINSTIEGGHADTGGGILNRGTLVMTDCTIGENNTVHVKGGGIDNAVGGTATLTRCTITGNSGTGITGGAGINNESTLSLTNSTISGNETNVDGGGIRSLGSLTLVNCTITNNTADANGDEWGAGGGIYAFGTVFVRNTIIAGNADLSPTGSAPDAYGSFTSQGYNLIGKSDGSSGFTNGVNNDIVGTIASPINPGLAALANYGGPTKTHALLSSSPALDAIPEGGTGYNNAPSTDQRGVARPQPIGGNCDMGAFEGFITPVMIRIQRKVPSLLPLASTNMAKSGDLMGQAEDLLQQAKAKNLDTASCEKLIDEARGLLDKARASMASPITANYFALKAAQKLNQAIDCLKALLG